MLWLTLERNNEMPLFRQIYHQLRTKILSGELKANEKLPSTRELAADLHISRNVVVEAYDQLITEGYLEGSAGSGTYVAEGAELLGFVHDSMATCAASEEDQHGNKQIIDFRTGIPALDLFPGKALRQVMQEVIQSSPPSFWSYGEPEGCPELRCALAGYLYKTRGVCCSSKQIIITSGTVQALSLLARLLVKPGDDVVLEDPVHVQIQKIFLSCGAQLRPVPVDNAGMQTDSINNNINPKCIYTSPSHQFPLGSVLSIQRRLELIRYARLKDCYILEDDYDSEFRYACAPISSLQGLTPDRVVYIGTFSKTLSPILRVGYMVLPPSLVGPCREQKWLADHHSPYLEQHMIARLIENGFLQRHITRMRKSYKSRQETMIQALKSHFPQIEISGHSTGLHLIADFKDVVFTDGLLSLIKKRGVHVYPVEAHTIRRGRHAGKLIFGYVNLSAEEINTGLAAIKRAISDNGPWSETPCETVNPSE